jgi:hypothetical protein
MEEDVKETRKKLITLQDLVSLFVKLMQIYQAKQWLTDCATIGNYRLPIIQKNASSCQMNLLTRL